MIQNKAFLLDRDGTINIDSGYIGKPEDIALINGVVEAIKKMHAAGYAVIVVTNQSGVARGKFTLEEVHKVNDRLNDILKEQGTYIDAFYICPHYENGAVAKYAVKCNCRKPALGLYIQAIAEFNLNAPACYACGDKESDIKRLPELGFLKENLALLSYVKGPGNYSSLLEFTDMVLQNAEK